MRYIEKVLPQQARSLEEEYGRDFPEVVTKGEKDDIFGPLIEGIEVFLQQASIQIPSDVGRRPYILSRDTFQDFERSILSIKPNPRAIALTHSRSGLVFINLGTCYDEAQYLGVDPKLVLRATGAHELAGHSLIHREVWLPEGVSNVKDIPGKKIRHKRKGAIEMPSRGVGKRLGVGAEMFEEGFAEYARRESLRLAGLPDFQLRHPWEVELLDILIGRLQGNNLLLRATYSKEDLEPFTAQLDALYGENSMRAILEEMGSDQEVDWFNPPNENDPESDPKFLYKFTKYFLKA